MTVHRLNRPSAGYTIVEILMSMAVLAVGLSGIIAMQRVTVGSNRHAKNLATATHIAQSWLSSLEAEAMLWESPTAVLPAADWHAVGLGAASWFRPTYNTSRLFGPSFDALGNPLSHPTDGSRYCVDLRVLTMLGGATAKSGVSRIEVRVAWAKEVTVLGGAPADICTLTSLQLTNPTGISEMHFVHLSTAIRSVDRLAAQGVDNATGS